MTPADFEQSVRESLMLDKFRAGLTEWMSVSDAELEREYKRRNEKVTLDVVAVLADNFKTQVNPTDAEISAHYDKNKETLSRPGSPEDQVRADQSGRAGRDHQGVEGRRRAELQRAARQLHDARADSREPHPADDRRQRRRRGARAGRAGAEGSEVGRRLRGARQEIFAGRIQRAAGRRPRLLLARPHGGGVRDGRVRARRRARSAISSRPSSAITSSR